MSELKENQRGFYLSIEGGKYKIFFNWSKDGQFEAKRYDQNWRDLVGDNLILCLCQELLEASKNRRGTLQEQLFELFEYEMSSIQEEYPELTHGAMTMTAAERVIEWVSNRINSLADNRKWGHIDEVNKAHFD